MGWPPVQGRRALWRVNGNRRRTVGEKGTEEKKLKRRTKRTEIGSAMDFLAGNPLSTPVGQRIEQATNSRLQAEDWALNIEICDIINETDEGPKDAVRAIKKRIVGNKNFREVMLALTVLETCVKNCGHRFHVLVSTREFVEGVLVRTILPKNNPPMVVHDRVLSLIQAWADAFRSSPTLTGVVSVYEDLKKRGLEFPMTDLDALSPIHTPHRSVPETEPSAPTPQSSAGPTSTQATSSPSNTEPSTLSPQQIQKLKADIEVVRGNQTVMSEMLNQLNPSNAKPSDIGLLQQLYTVCRCMQERALELIPRLTNEGLIEELLAVNDDLNNAFLSYHRFERLRNSPNATQEPSDTDPANLIDLSPAPQSVNEPAAPPANQHNSESAVNTLSSQMANLSAGVDDEFDMFAQTRGSSLAEQRKSVRYEDPGAMEGLAGALDTRQQVTGVIPAAQNVTSADIEEWLAADAERAPEESEGVCSEEFDKFLKERAKVADQLPSLSDTSSSTVQHQAQSTWQQDSSNDQLFML